MQASEKKQKMNIFLSIMTSGKPFYQRDEATMDTMVRYILLNSMIFLGGTLLVIFGLESIKSGAPIQGMFDLSMAGMTLLAFVILRTAAPFILSGFMTVIPYMMLCAFLAVSGGVQGSGVLWIYSFPLLSIFLLGMKSGIALSTVLLFIVSAAVFIPGVSPMKFETSFALRTVGVYILVLVCTIVYEQTKLVKDRWVARLTNALQVERDEITAMKDNLKVGLFLINRDYIIQPQYSKALETVMAETDLSGKSFIDVLSNSLQKKELETLQDYFTMVFNRSYDTQMLEDINPLHQFKYTSLTGSEEKTLRCSFAPIDREDGKVYILGTVEDTTREAELQQQLSEEESKRQEEMRSLFEVIHVEPRVLNDFIVDTEYEFERINEIMKKRDENSSVVVNCIYQSVHAIKSNAVILGLQSFATKLHLLEDELRGLREHMDVSFQEILHITVELEKLMKIKDGFKELIGKILAFNTGDGKLQEEHVLVQTLERVVQKASDDLGKRARLTIAKVDPRAIEHGPRRAIKEVLMQLVRNSMTHGIEKPEERLARGKEEEGCITLTIDMVKDRIEIKLSDDGNGLDFDAIRKKAVELSLVGDEAELQDKSSVLKILFAPGFSTTEKADMHSGRGVGLNLVKERVKELKGTIKLQSEDGKGTVFIISIPPEQDALTGVQTA
ncbi:MAG: hypothetical protein JW875_04835 [Spirochaetales bacterium]|nr:hypothetical protein [Spirochaetales bacterium]